MGRVARVVVASLIVSVCVLACESETPANAKAECGSDANCELSPWTADCCPRCKPFAGTTAEVASLDDSCKAMSPASARCPELKCPPHEGPDYIAKCVSGRCVVGP